jgi:hypothetical protein
VVLLMGLLSGSLLARAGGVNITIDGSVASVLMSSGGGAVAAGTIAASVIAMFLRHPVSLAAVSTVAAALAGGSALLLGPAAFEYAAAAIGSVLLGCAAVAVFSSNRSGVQVLLITGFLTGLLTAGAFEALEIDVPRRYQDYLIEANRGTSAVVPALALATVVALLCALRRAPFEKVPPVRSGRMLLAAVAVPLCGLLVQWLFLRRLHGRSSDLDGLFYFGVFAIPVCLVAAALIPGRGGRIVLAGTAVLATSSTVASSSIDVSVDPLWTYGLVLVCAVAVATGAALGQRWKRPLIGTAVLAVVCLTALFDGPTGDVAHYAASSVIFPAAAAYLYVSCNADTAPALTVGLAVPVAITVPMVLSYGWTAYTPLTSVDSSTFSPSLDLWISTGTACAAVALAAAGIQALDRYRAVL